MKGKVKTVTKRIACWLLAFAMAVTMIPITGGQLVAQAADGDKNLTIHVMLPDSWNWGQPAIQFWGGTYNVSGNTNGTTGTEITGWNGAVGFFLTQGDSDNSVTEYSLTVQGSFTGFQLLDFKNTSNKVNPAYDAKLSQYTQENPTDVYYIYNSADKSWTWYLDKNGSEVIPDLPETETTFLLTGDENLALLGIPKWNAAAEPNFVQDESDANKYTLVLKNVPANTYSYKILRNSKVQEWNDEWGASQRTGDNQSLTVNAPADITFSLDATDSDKKFSVKTDYIKDLAVETPAQLKKGETEKLSSTGTYYDGSGSGESISVSYSTDAEGVTIDGTSITIPSSYKGENVIVKANAGEIEKDITIPVVDNTYKYTIYYYDTNNDAHMKAGAADLWLWEIDGAEGKAFDIFKETEILSDGKTWLKGTLEVPYTNLGMIVRSNGGWNWKGTEGDTLYNNNAKAADTTLYLVSGSTTAYTTLPEIKESRTRYVMVEYDRTNNDYDDWNIFTWNSGFGTEVSIGFTEQNGKRIAKIPVKDSTEEFTLSFCMRRSTDSNAWAEKDGGDHYVVVPANQTLVEAVFTQGEGIISVLPYNVGYEMDGANDQIHFYYRDDTLSAAYNLASLGGKVSVVVNGEEYPMTYDAENDRYSYDLKGVETGKYYYYYTVDGKVVLDAFNEATEEQGEITCNVFTYKKLNAAVSAALTQSAMDSDDNNVLSISFIGDSLQKDEIASITADLTELGLSSSFAIEPSLMEGTISCRDTVSAGKKNIPVTVKDIYGNVYTTSVSVTVTESKTASGDFDWDEAVIYFAVTDRFFDGDSSNNDAYGVGDYNTGDKSGSSYHGGDFAGLTEKLDYLKELGVNTIWITPIVENITEDQHDDKTGTATYGYHGYWASNFTTLNKHLGTEKQFSALLSAAHSKGMKIMVDVVLNHAGYGTESYFNSILSGKSMIRDASNTISGDDKYDALSDLPDFVTEDEDVRDQLIEWQTSWMTKYPIDYYRVDTVKHVDTTTWEAFKNALTKVNPDFKMIGEYSGAGYANTAGELGTGSMDALLDFDFNDFAQKFVTGGISEVENSLEKRNGSINNTATLGSFLNSHDEDSLQYKLVNESELSEDAAYDLMKVAASLMITAKGQPVIYYGEEIGQAGANNWPVQSNRRDFDWEELTAQQADSNSIYQHYKTMLSIRNAYTDVFTDGTRTAVASSDADGYDVFARAYGGTKLYVGMNIKDSAQTISVPVTESAGTTMKDLYSGKTYTVGSDQTVSIEIPKAADGGTFVLVKSAKGGSSSSGGSGSSGTVTPSETTKTDTNTKTETKADGSTVETTTIQNLPENTTASLVVTTDASGEKTVEAVVETTGTETKSGVKATISAEVVKALTDEAGSTDVTITQTVKKADGTVAYTVELQASDLKDGAKLTLMAKDEKTGELVLVTKKTCKVKDGSVSVKAADEGNYVLLNAKDVKSAVQKIVKTVKAKKATVSVKKNKKTTFNWSKKLNMANVAKITYSSSKKSVAKVNKNGKITAKKKGTAKVKAKVTLKNGTKKTVTITVKVK